MSVKVQAVAILATALAMAVTIVIHGPATIIPCDNEDSEQLVCYWDAHKRGNGEGTPFLKVGNLIIPI